jgi:hypothetical protein
MAIVLDKDPEKARKQIEDATKNQKNVKSKKKVDLRKFLGVLKTDIDPLEYQSEIRG